VKRASADTSTYRSRLAALSAAALGVLALSAGAAFAQSGGITPPSEEPAAGEPAPAPAPTGGPSQVFPLPSAHTYGDGFGVSRGAGRSHQGQDIFAPCGAQLVAVMNGRIVFNGTHSAAGNYIVLRNKKVHRDYVYMHLRKPGLPKGTKVTRGQWIGSNGDSGNASGCHLHFEIWKGKWYRGGYPMNPLPSLQSWDSYS
jgi:murein DD-endopeptidase MepM/ murein hydrolase activator NlpD